MAGRRRDHPSGGSCRREAPRLLLSVGCGEQPHRPPRDPHRATHPRTRIHCPRVPVPCFPADFPFIPFVFGRRRALERVAFLCRKGAELLPASIPAPLALPSPPADPHGGGSLEPASADALALFAAALAALTRFCSRVRAGTILSEARTQRRPATPLPPRRRPPHCAATAAPGPHPLSIPLPSLISPSPSISTLTTPPPSTAHASRHPNHPPPRCNPAHGRMRALLWWGSFFVVVFSKRLRFLRVVFVEGQWWSPSVPR